MKLIYLYFILFTLVLLSCDHPFVVTPSTQGINTVTGMYITNENGEIYSVWRKPSVNENGGTEKINGQEEEFEIPSSMALFTPYPNPFVTSTTIRFQLPSANYVSIWLETAYLPQSVYPLPNQSQIEKPFKRYFLLGSRFSAGKHSLILGTVLNEKGDRLPPGLYRIFFNAGNFTAYHDIYIPGEGISTPIGLSEYSNH